MKAIKSWQFWVGILISVVFLYYALRGLGLQELGNALAQANYIWILPGVAVYFMGFWVRAWRWHYLLRPVKKIPTRTMFPILTIGYMGNNIFPARMGEVLRAVVLKKHEDVPISASLATIIVERVFDGVVMLGFVFLNLQELTHLTTNSGFIGDIRTLALVGSGVFIGALVVFLLMAMFPLQAERIIVYLVQRFLPSAFRPPDFSGLIKRLWIRFKHIFSPDSATKAHEAPDPQPTRKDPRTPRTETARTRKTTLRNSIQKPGGSVLVQRIVSSSHGSAADGK